MTAERERPLGLDMDPDEAFERFLSVKPEELPEHVQKGLVRNPRSARVPVAKGPD